MATQPIFILGSGRSGTTILYNLLAVHPDLCWFSELTDFFYYLPHLSSLHRVLELPWVGSAIKRSIMTAYKKHILYPAEGEKIYHTLANFAHARKTPAANFGAAKADLLKQRIADHMTYTGKHRFLNKQTSNTQRLALMHKLFPHAYWIHIIRDGRAVAYSLRNVPWWPNVRLWWIGKTLSELDPDGTTWLELSAEHWKRNVREIRSQAVHLRPRYMEIRYEDLVRNPKKILRQIIRFTKLSTDPSYLRSLPTSLTDNNTKWHRALSEREKRTMESVIGPYLRTLGYRS